jgi:hypothetical protein
MQVERMVDSSSTWWSEVQDSMSRSECIPNSMTLRTEKVAQEAPRLIYVIEVSGSNLIRDFFYHDWLFSWFYSLLPGKCKYTSNYGVTASFSMVSSLSINHSMICTV